MMGKAFELRFAKVSYESAYRLIRSEWKVSDEG